MAGPGTDAAEGDGSRSAAQVTRATGWRVPSVVTTESGLPTAWLDGVAEAPAVEGTGPSPGETTRHAEIAEFGRAEVMLRQRRRWSFRRKSREPEPPEAIEPDIDLVALGDDEARAWTDLTLAALEEPDATDDDTSTVRLDGFAFVSPGAGDPWSVLADELQESDEHDVTEPAPSGTESTALELEAEFWT